MISCIFYLAFPLVRLKLHPASCLQSINPSHEHDFAPRRGKALGLGCHKLILLATTVDGLCHSFHVAMTGADSKSCSVYAGNYPPP